MGKVRLGAAPARRLLRTSALLMPLMSADPSAADHCPTVFCRHMTSVPDDPVVAPVPSALPLRVDYVHDIASSVDGYDRANNTYRDDWLERVLFNPPSRPFQSLSCQYEAAALPQEPVDDFGSCEDLGGRLAPDGIASIRWSLVDPEGLLTGEEILDEKTYALERARPVIGSDCILEIGSGPPPLVVPPAACIFEASAPPPPAAVAVANDAYSYTVRIEWLDSDGTVVRSGSQDIAIPRSAPLIVSLGDSFASGEGNPDQDGRSEHGGIDDCFDDTSQMVLFDNNPDMISEPIWFEPRDHRSMRSASALAARALLEDYPYLVFLSLAKSGAGVEDGDSDSGPDVDLLEQLRTLQALIEEHPDRKIDVLLISIGGNDVGFADILEGFTTGWLNHGEALDDFQAALDVLSGADPGGGYPLVDQTIDQLELNVSNILITEYPVSLFNRADNTPREGCEIFEGFDADLLGPLSIGVREAELIGTMGESLNAEIHRTSSLYGWRVVDGIAKRFESRGYCSGEDARYFLWVEESCDRQGDFEGTMHPNRAGTRVAAQEIERHLRAVLPPPPNAQDPVLGTDPVAPP